MEDREILDCIHALVAQQRRLRDQVDDGSRLDGTEAERLVEIAANLEEMWTLLRRRRALRAVPGDRVSVSLRTPVHAVG
jgi:hypothetical protein